MTYGVIMAGGQGTRFWPRSLANRPKQFLKLFGDRTMIQMTVDRLGQLIPEERCMVVTNVDYTGLVRDQLPGIKDDFIIGEPVARNTAPCIASAAALLQRHDPDAVMVVLPADHRIADEETFRSVLASAISTANEEKTLVTIGIEPDRPETGYGYIRYNQEKSRSRKEHSAFPVLGFTEKPDREKAISFLDQGGYLWNSGMFVWRADSILEAFRKHQPEIWSELEKWTGESVTRSEIDRFYQNCPSVSVDYGIMEQADNVQVLPAEFGWNDVGSWRAVYDLAEKDADGNAVMNTNVTIQESQNSYISTTGKRHVALVGVENVAVVETEKGLLICDLDRVQEVKEVVERLRREEGGDEWL